MAAPFTVAISRGFVTSARASTLNASGAPARSRIAPRSAGSVISLVRCRAEEAGEGVLVVEFRDEAGEQVARNASPFTVEPGKFTYRLVRAELTYATTPSTIEAHCCVGQGPVTVVPLTLLPPVG